MVNDAVSVCARIAAVWVREAGLRRTLHRAPLSRASVDLGVSRRGVTERGNQAVTVISSVPLRGAGTGRPHSDDAARVGGPSLDRAS